LTSISRVQLPIYSTQLNEENSPFLRLPAELRNRIYKFGLYEDVIDFKSRYPSLKKPNLPKALAFLCICRQVYCEVSVLYFALNTFRFDSEKSLEELIGFIAQAKLDAVKYISFTDNCAALIAVLANGSTIGLPDLRLYALTSLQEVTVHTYSQQIIWLDHITIGVYLRQAARNMGLEVIFVEDEPYWVAIDGMWPAMMELDEFRIDRVPMSLHTMILVRGPIFVKVQASV
jgi:hypothetical protein